MNNDGGIIKEDQWWMNNEEGIMNAILKTTITNENISIHI